MPICPECGGFYSFSEDDECDDDIDDEIDEDEVEFDCECVKDFDPSEYE